MLKTELNLKPKVATKALLSALADRAYTIIEKRYGLGKDADRLTLEAIGKQYKITRERVRQIENFAIQTIKKSDVYNKAKPAFDELVMAINRHGGIVHEQEFLESVSKDESTQNHVHFLLVLGDAFTKLKEDDDFHHRWTVDKNLADKVHTSLRKVCASLSAGDLVSEEKLISSFLNELKTNLKGATSEEVAKKWLVISKGVNKNPLGEWGLSKSPNIKMRGIRDYAYLVLRQHGSPMHFNEVAKAISTTFGKKAHAATCHNELIKDKRFVLVGRGLYALAEWGYERGVVRDIIKKVLKGGPLTRDEIIQRVLKERYVKENTIIVNLQNPEYFHRNKDGRYIAV